MAFSSTDLSKGVQQPTAEAAVPESGLGDGLVLLDAALDAALARISDLQHYIGKAANRLGVDRPGDITGNNHDVERIGEAVLAAIEGLRDAQAPRQAALQLIASTQCSRHTGMRCSAPFSGDVLGAPWSADAWCDSCIAHAALTDTWPVVTPSSEWGVLYPNGEIVRSGTLGEESARVLAQHVRGAVIREARRGVWVVSPDA